MFLPVLCFYHYLYIATSYVVTVPFLLVVIYFLIKRNYRKANLYSALGFLSWVLFDVCFLMTQKYIDARYRLECENKVDLSALAMLGVLGCVALVVGLLVIKKVNYVLNKRTTTFFSGLYLLLILIPAIYFTTSDMRSSDDEVVSILLLLPIHTAYYLYEGSLMDF